MGLAANSSFSSGTAKLVVSRVQPVIVWWCSDGTPQRIDRRVVRCAAGDDRRCSSATSSFLQLFLEQVFVFANDRVELSTCLGIHWG
jgi:hypothetical protein